MLRLVALLFTCSLFSLTYQQTKIYEPRPEPCLRKHGKVWWERFGDDFEKKCEVNPTDGEECGICGRPCISCYRKTTIYPACWHKGMGWKFDIIKSQESNQDCLNMNHCSQSYLLKDKSKLNQMCGKETDTEEQRGKCTSVYGTYICECKKPYQGRDCTDLGPAGAYATGVQALLDTKVRVSEPMTILIAVKNQGNNFKVHINMLQYSTILTLTEPIIKDPSSKGLIQHCKLKTHLKEQCDTYLNQSTSIYSIDLRFPLVRDFSVWYYEDKTTKIHYPIGYNTTFTITTTNKVDGIEKESFFRTHYDKNYIVFVEYPIYLTCYENVQIDNCKEVQEIVKTYDASKEIVFTGNLPEITFNEPTPKLKIECSNDSDDTMTWRLSQIKPNGEFIEIDEQYVKDDISFVIKPFTLSSSMYRADFTYKMTTNLGIRENFDQCFFTVEEAPLIAIIEGGRSRYVDVDTMIVLDGSESYDPNIGEDTNKFGLIYEWSCILNQTGSSCLGKYIVPQEIIKLPPAVLESKKEYIINLVLKKKGKKPAQTSQTLYTGSKGKILSIGIKCANCMEGNIANPTDYIYLLVNIVLKEPENIDSPTNYTWTFSTFPDYPPTITAESYRVNQTSEFLLKVEKKKLKQNRTYSFRAAVQGEESIFSDIDIRIPMISSFTCTLTPESGTVAVTEFILSCSINSNLTYEVYDKRTNDPDYFSGRMLFTGFSSPKDNHFKLANNKVVVYGYNKFKMIEKWDQEIELTPFDKTLKDIDDMVVALEQIKIYPQRLLHSASVIPGALRPEMDWSTTSILKSLISFVHHVKLGKTRYIKLVLSSIEFILVLMSKNNEKSKFQLDVEEAKMCSDIIFALASRLFDEVKVFENIETLTETILHQMIASHLNVIEIVLSVKQAKVLSKPFYLVNPYTTHLVKDTTYNIVDALYKLSACLLWRQIKGNTATEIVSPGSNITEWVMVNNPEVLYRLRNQSESIPFNFSFGFFQIMKNVDALGIQVTNINVNPFWWAGGDINTNILLVDLCFKVKPTKCKYHQTFYKAPIFLYFNISHIYSAIKPLELHTSFLNFTNKPYILDLDITVYRFDLPLRAKLFIHFEFVDSTEDYKVLFSENMRPDIDMMYKKGITINNGNQSSTNFIKYNRDDSDKLYYMGIYPVHKGEPGKQSKFKLTIVYAVCKTWLKWKWGSQRCWVGEQETNNRTLRCDCNHLSMFAGAVQVPSYLLNPAMEFMLFLTEEFNWLPLLVLIIILLIFIILYIWGLRKDRKDSVKGFVTVLEDNYPGESFGYLIGVYTGSRINSRTSANVGIRLFGENWKSRAHVLKNSDRPILQSNSDDWFLIYTPAHLGTLECLHIWHDNSGKSPDWFIENIEVYDLTEKLKYTFELHIWLALGVSEYPEAIANTASIFDFYSVRRVFISNVVTGFKDTNYWTSIFWKHARNPVKRIQRITVVLSFIMVAMVCSIFIYHYNKGERYEEDEPSYDLNDADFIVLVLTFTVASLTASLIMFLFRKSYSHSYLNRKSTLFLRSENVGKISSFYSSNRNEYRSQTEMSRNLNQLSMVSLYDSERPRFIELSYKNLEEKFIRLGLRSKSPRERSMYEKLAASIHAVVRGSTLTPVRLPSYKSSVILHKKYFFTAWLIFLIIILFSAAFVILFGHRVPHVESQKWLTIFLCALLFDALILSTLKILMCSMVLGCVFQRVVPESNYQIKAEDGINRKLFGNKKFLFHLAQTRSSPMYFPLGEHLKLLYRQKCLRREQWSTFIDFLVVLLLILVMINAIYTENYYRSNSHAISMLTQGPSYKYQNFTNIYNRTLYSKFLIYNFVDRLHRYLWYNQEDLLKDNDHLRRRAWTYDCTTKLLGDAQIRQLRVILGECSDVNYFEDIEDFCSPPWSAAVEDTGTYSSRWYSGRNEPLRQKSTAWRYTDASHSNVSTSYGATLTSYPTGGYIEDLGFEKDDIEGTLASLIPQNWLDHMTRAVFVELTLYNVNTQLFSHVILVAEQMPTGEYLVAIKADSVITDFDFDIWKFSFFVFFVFFLVRMCVLINRKGLIEYFSEIINVYEMLLLALGFFTFFFYLIHIKSSSEYVHEFQRIGIDEFFNFFHLISYILWSRTAMCTLFVCLIVRLLISLRFGRVYFTFFYTLFLSMPWIIWLVLYFIVYLVLVQRYISYRLNLFIIPYRSIMIIYYNNFSASANEDFSYKIMMYLMCLPSYVVILFFIASFAYYYKVAKIYKLIDTDKLNFLMFLKERIKNSCKINK